MPPLLSSEHLLQRRAGGQPGFGVRCQQDAVATVDREVVDLGGRGMCRRGDKSGFGRGFRRTLDGDALFGLLRGSGRGRGVGRGREVGRRREVGHRHGVGHRREVLRGSDLRRGIGRGTGVLDRLGVLRIGCRGLGFLHELGDRGDLGCVRDAVVFARSAEIGLLDGGPAGEHYGQVRPSPRGSRNQRPEHRQVAFLVSGRRRVGAEEDGVDIGREHEAAERKRIVRIRAAAYDEPARARRHFLQPSPLTPGPGQHGDAAGRRASTLETHQVGDQFGGAGMLAGADELEKGGVRAPHAVQDAE